MPLVIACPSCGSKIKAPDSVRGKTISCPKCQARFRAEAAPTPAALPPLIGAGPAVLPPVESVRAAPEVRVAAPFATPRGQKPPPPTAEARAAAGKRPNPWYKRVPRWGWVLLIGLFVLGAFAQRRDRGEREADMGGREAAWAEKKAAKAAEKADKAEEEKADKDTLVLLEDTLSAIGDEFSSAITGIVVNGRSRRLSSATITFNLYDQNGAKVGSVSDSIRGLDPGERWRFRAVTFRKFNTYTFSKLSGF